MLPSATHGYDASDRLTSDTYDPNGNTLAALMRDPVNGIPRSVADQYDFEDQLLFRQTTINGQPTEVLLAYDGDGNRVKKTVTTGSASTSYFYVVDNLNPTGYAQVIEELQPVSGNPVQLAVYRAYTYGLQRVSQDQLIGNQWVASYYGYDGQGSVRFLTDAAGDVTDTYDYDSFGILIARSGNTPNVYLYRGEQYDAELGLYYLRARYANPETGRFWTADTFEGFADDPHSLHKYTFNHNDPVNRIDPSGHMSLTELSASVTIGAMSGAVFGTFLRAVTHYNSFRKAELQTMTQQTGLLIAGTSSGVGARYASDDYWIARQGGLGLQAEAPLFNWDTCTSAPIMQAGLPPFDPVAAAANLLVFGPSKPGSPSSWPPRPSAWEDWCKAWNQATQETNLGTRVYGALAMLGGALQAGTLSGWVLTVPGGGPVMAAVVFLNGLDWALEGGYRVLMGRANQTDTSLFISTALENVGVAGPYALATGETISSAIGVGAVNDNYSSPVATTIIPRWV